VRARHPVFQMPIERGAPVWRYFDFPKFVSLLKERSLYFCRADLLGDPPEGSFTRAREVERERVLASLPTGKAKEEKAVAFGRHANLNAAVLKGTYVNCWHQGDHESMALWRGYGGGPCGVAIRSTVDLLDRLIPEQFDPAPSPTWEANAILIGAVRYVDYASELERVPNDDNAYAPFVCKSVAYEHESEIRALFMDFVRDDVTELPAGRSIPVDLESLILQVIVSPLSPDWFGPLVNDTCQRFGARVTVGHSTVGEAPVY
jgi:hypothetical protein